MANRWKGNIIAAAATTSSGTDYTGKANGSWGLNSQLQQKQGGLWAKGVGVPSAPIIGTATSPSSSTAIVNFTNSTDSGGFTITSYTATSTPSGITASNTTSPITVTGLTDGTSYTFTVHANNAAGASPESAASNSVTPSATISAILFGIGDVTGTSPYITAYQWSSGYGSKYANPSVLPESYTLTAKFNSTGSKVISAITASPCINIYTWDNGFGSRYANPTSLPAITVGRNVCFNSNDTAAFIVGDTTPYVQAYSFSSSGFGAKYANPSTSVGGTAGQSVSLNPAENTIAIGSNGTPFVQAYSWNTSTGFGAKYANPSTLPTSSVLRDTLFNPTGTILFCAHNGTPFISAYNWSSGFGSKITNPSVLPIATGYRLAFKDDYIALANESLSSPDAIVTVYPFTADFGSKVANPSTLVSMGDGRGIAFNSAGDTISISGALGVFQSTYAWVAGSFGTRYANPSTALQGQGFSVAFTPY